MTRHDTRRKTESTHPSIAQLRMWGPHVLALVRHARKRTQHLLLRDPHPLKPPDHDSDDDSTSDDSEVDHHDASSPHSAPAQNRTASLTPAAYFRALTNNALQPPPSPPPLLHPPNGPLFPRSVNASKSLPASDSLRIQTLRTRLLARLDKPLPFDLRSLAPFAGRPALPPARRAPPPRPRLSTT